MGYVNVVYPALTYLENHCMMTPLLNPIIKINPCSVRTVCWFLNQILAELFTINQNQHVKFNY